MRVQHLAAGLVACAALALAGDARAGGDDIPLSMPGGADAATLDRDAPDADSDADIHFVQYRGGRGYGGYRGGYGGYRGGYGGYRGGYGGYRGYYGGYRGYYGGYRGYYRPYYYGGYRGYYRPYYYGGYYRPYYYPRYYGGYGYGYYPSSYYYPGYYISSYPAYYPAVSYYGSSFYFPCDGVEGVARTLPGAPAMPGADEKLAPVPGTFDYDGGPKNPVPLPKTDEGPVKGTSPDRAKAGTELLVSQTTAPAGRWVYPGYGEKARREQ